MAWLQQQEDHERIHLRYFDASGLSLTPVVPYGWQPMGETYCIPCERSPRLNLLGFLGRKNELFFRTSEQSVNTDTVIAAFDAFAEDYYESEFKQSGKLCFVVLDNASMHRSQAFTRKMDDWLIRGVIPRFIPPYCPELNLIEILWRKLKYQWLPMSAYQSLTMLKTSVVEVLENVGSKFLITFN